MSATTNTYWSPVPSVTSWVWPALTCSRSSIAFAMVPIEITIITIPMIAVTTKITIAQMIPVHEGFFTAAPPGLE